MKKRRFEELHRRAIRWPEGKLDYIGIDGSQKRVTNEAKQGEVRCKNLLSDCKDADTPCVQLANAYLPFKKDLYGCHSKLASKRIARNPFLRFHPYWASAKELRALLEWCPDGRSRKPGRRLWWNMFDSDSRRDDGGGDSSWDLVYPGQLPWDN